MGLAVGVGSQQRATVVAPGPKKHRERDDGTGTARSGTSARRSGLPKGSSTSTHPRGVAHRTHSLGSVLLPNIRRT